MMPLHAPSIGLAAASLMLAITIADPAGAESQPGLPPSAEAPQAAPAGSAPGPANERPAPLEQGRAAPQAPAEPPPGCTYRNNKLDLIV